MRKIIVIAILIGSIVSCKEKVAPTTTTINIEDLQPSPKVHSALSEEQLKQIKTIQETFNEVYPISLEKTIENFKRDLNPDKEINVWLNMVKAFQSFSLKNTGEDNLSKRKEAFKLILLCSMMSEEEAISNSEIKLLTTNEVQEILKYYKVD